MSEFSAILRCGLAAAMLALLASCSGSSTTSTPAAAAASYTITASAGAGGAISPPGSTTVARGASAAFTITPDAGYVMASLTVDGATLTGAIAAYSFTEVRANHSLSATFKPAPAFRITVVQGANGTISPGSAALAAGEDQTFSINGNPGFVVDTVTVDGVAMGALASYTFTAVQADHSIGATFKATPGFSIRVTAGPNGSISPATDTAVRAGADQAFAITPDAGYVVDTVKVDGAAIGAPASYTFTAVQADHSLSASFRPAASSFSITASAGQGGSISPAGTNAFAAGGNPTFGITPDSGYAVDTVSVDGDVLQGDITHYVFYNLQSDHSIAVTFRVSPETFIIKVSQGPNGSINPSDPAVPSGADQPFTITADTGYLVDKVYKDGVDQGRIGTCTFSKVLGEHTISATFKLDPGSADGSLAHYGFNPTMNPPVDPNTGKAASATYNPLGGLVSVLKAKREIFFAGTPITKSSPLVWANAIDEFKAPDYSALKPFEFTTGVAQTIPAPYCGNLTGQPHGCPKASVAGDLKGLGKDCVVTAYYVGSELQDPAFPLANVHQNFNGRLMISVLNPDGSVDAPFSAPNGTQILPFFVQSGDNTNGESNQLQGQVSVTLLDIDGDGNLEIAALVDSTLFILDDFQHGYQLLYRHDYRADIDPKSGINYGTAPANLWWSCRLAAGDINGDGREELVTVQNVMTGTTPAIYHVYGWSDATALPVELASNMVSDQDGTRLQIANVAIGNVTGNGKQILFSGCSSTSYSYSHYIYDDGRVLMGSWKSFYEPSGAGTIILPGGGASLAFSWPDGSNISLWQILPTTCFRQSYDKPQCLFAVNQVVAYDANTGSLKLQSHLPESLSSPQDYNYYGLQVAAAGDVDQDGEEELVTLYSHYSSHTTHLQVFKTKGKAGELTAEVSFQLANWWNSDSDNYADWSTHVYPALCLPNFKGEGLQLRFQPGSWAPSFSTPVAIAALAAPPYWSDYAGQDPPLGYGNLGNCFTSFGHSQSSGTSTTSTFSMSSSISVGFKVQDEITQSEGEFKASISASLSKSSSDSIETTASQEYSTPPTEDQVILSTIPYDNYTYSLVNSPGSSLIIGVPRKALVMPIELNAYNAIPGNANPIPPAFLGHTIGNPYSYMTYQEMRNYMVGAYLWDPRGISAGYSSGYASSSAEQVASNSNGCGVGVGFGFEFEAVFGGFMIGGSVDYSFDRSVEYSTSLGTTIAGASPGLPLSAPMEKLYNFGIASYLKYLPTQPTPINVVTYWVDPMLK